VKKTFLLTLALSCISSLSLSAQLSVNKMIGKNAGNYKLGYGVFTYYDIPVNEVGNRSVRIELLDLAYFPGRASKGAEGVGYLSIKLGYKNIFSETRTGFYVEPQVGYCRVVGEEDYGDGIAAAAEVGYSQEVGQGSNTINLGVKYETDRAGKEHTISSVGLRLSFSFSLFRRRE
jgi:hypothetical protein